jgi:hypothetical protein
VSRKELLVAAVLALLLGSERDVAHERHASSRKLSEDYDALGIFGECKFAFEFGLQVDKHLRLGGDNGIDFHTRAGTVDVKTARKPFNLLVEQTKVASAADILVLCQFLGFTVEPVLLGWAYREEVADSPVRDFGYGILNHYVPAAELRDIETLRPLIEDVLPLEREPGEEG